MQLRKTLVFPLLLATMSVFAGQARAQRTYTVGVAGGAAFPTGRFNDAYSKGQAATAFLGVGLAELPIGLRFDGMYQKFAGRLVTPSGGGAEVQTPDLKLWGLGGNFVVTTSGTTAKPYLIVGGGFYNIKADSADAKSRNRIGFSGGVGSTFSLGPFASVVEARFHSISRNPTDGGSIHFAPLLLGIMF